MSWRYDCGDCPWFVMVGDRGGHGRDQGAGYEAAKLMERHRAEYHPEPPQPETPGYVFGEPNAALRALLYPGETEET